MENTDKKKGLVLLYTGNGKGKSTAAFGQVLRAVGHGWPVCIIQFIKANGMTGEAKSFAELADKVEFHIKGTGFIFKGEAGDEVKKTAREAFNFARKKIMSGLYRMVVLDEFTYLLNYKMVSWEEVRDLIEQRPAGVHLVITGRSDNEKLMEAVDLVTEMKEIKHPYQAGVKARQGIEF